MRALVTGATGFVGANLVEALSERGWQVCALHRSTSSMAALTGLDYEPVVGDVLDYESLCQAMQGCDAVFHAAGVTADYWQRDLDRLYRVNVEGTRNVLRAAETSGVARLVHTSSLAALGFADGDRPLTEEHQFNLSPETYPYGHSKHLGELEVQAAARKGLHAVIVSPSTVIGPRDATLTNSQIILEVQKGRIPVVPPGGMNVVDATDLAQGHLLALQRGQPGERYLLAGHNVTHLHLVKAVGEVLSVRAPQQAIPRLLIGPLARILDGAHRLSPRPLPLSGDILRFGSLFFYADNSRAVRELGFSVTALPITLRRAVAWLRSEGHL